VSREPDNPFPPDAVEAIVRHMNDDHADDSLVICRAFGGRPDAERVTMTGLDGGGMDFRAVVPEGEVVLRVPWGEPLTERAQVRVEVVRLHTAACEALGLPPATPSEH
jgi:putative heme iron utilization protein